MAHNRPKRTSDIAFTSAVRTQQSLRGTRAVIEQQIERQDWSREITPDLARFIASRDSVFFGTATASGQPYIQHRGGQPGFLHVLGATTIAFADLEGNKQYISLGNLAENDRVHLFLIDNAHRQRIKIWGTAQVIEGDEALSRQLPHDISPERSRVIMIEVDAWTANCPSHIPVLYDEPTIRQATSQLTRRIAELEAELEELRSWFGKQ